MPSFLSVIGVILLVLANAVFVAAEFALVRSRVTRLKSPEMKQSVGVRASLKLIEVLDESVSVTQLGITVASLMLGWFGEVTLHRFFRAGFETLGEPFASYASHGVATACALVLVTILHVVIGELVAKSIAIRYPEQTLVVLAPPMLLLSKILHPFVIIFTVLANACLKLLGLSAVGHTEPVHSVAELSMLITHSTASGVLDKTEEEMLRGVFGFSETVAREIMTPRTDLEVIAVNATFEEVVGVVVKSGKSRFPVVGEGVDNILGILLARDLLPYLHGHLSAPGKGFSVRELIREAYFIPGTKSIDHLLTEMKYRKVHIAIVLDEHGGVDGVVTLEDIIEEIVGDIYDESDLPERNIFVEDNGDVVVDGGVLVADLNNQFEFEIPEGDYDTIAGFIFTSLGRMPAPGDRIMLDGHRVVPLSELETPENVLDWSFEGLETGNGGDEEPSNRTEVTPNRAMVTVEQVAGNRVETVRVKRFLPAFVRESGSPVAASNSKT